MNEIKWDIRREERAWKEEAFSRYEMRPEKFEMSDGKLFFSEEERITLLALLLENVGVDKAILLGDFEVWREAVRAKETGK